MFELLKWFQIEVNKIKIEFIANKRDKDKKKWSFLRKF